MASIVLARGVAGELFDIDAPKGGPTSESHLIYADPNLFQVSCFDLGFSRGDGFFEAISVIDGKIPVSLDLHLERLVSHTRTLELPLAKIDAFREACWDMIARFKGKSHDPMLRIFISRGFDPKTGIGKEHHPGVPSVWMYIDGEGTEHSTKPLSLSAISSGRPSDAAKLYPYLLLGIKSMSYLVNMSAEREAARRGVDDVIFQTTDKYALECTHAAIVARYGSVWVTPDPSIGIVWSTSQRELFAYAKRLGMETRYEKLSMERLKEADEVYETRGGWVIPVKQIDDAKFRVNEEFVKEANQAIHFEQPEQEKYWEHE